MGHGAYVGALGGGFYLERGHLFSWLTDRFEQTEKDEKD